MKGKNGQRKVTMQFELHVPPDTTIQDYIERLKSAFGRSAFKVKRFKQIGRHEKYSRLTR